MYRLFSPRSFMGINKTDNKNGSGVDLGISPLGLLRGENQNPFKNKEKCGLSINSYIYLHIYQKIK